MIKKLHESAVIACGLLLSTTAANAAGFALQEQSVSGLGNAFAGGAAVAEDNSVIFTNPAALTLLDSAEVQLGVHVIGTSAEMTNTGSTSFGVPVQGDTHDASETGVIPNLYVSQPLNEDWVLGMGITVPFGLASDWGADWFGRYVADYSELKEINFQPTLAYKISEQWSVGIGLDYAQVDAQLTNAVDMGLALLSFVQAGAIPAALLPQDLVMGQSIGTSKYDGHFDVSGDGATWGYNIGVLFQPTDSTRIGLHYRSEIDVDIEGKVDWETPSLESEQLNAVLAGYFPDGGGEVDLKLPSITNLSLFQQIGEKWAVMADFQYTTWSCFDDLIIRFTAGSPSNSVTPENWNDVWRVAGGVSYQASDKLKLRGGIAWDESPVPNPEYRSPRIPDADRIWFSTGCEYVFNDHFRINAAATVIVLEDAGVNNDTHASAFHLKSDMDASVKIFSLSGIFSF